MLKSIRLKNFKLHEDTSIEAAPITVFIGPNNSGKSSIFQALLALRQAALRGNNFFCQPLERQPTSRDQPYLFPGGDLVDLGDFKGVVRKGQEHVEIELSGNYAHDTSSSSFPPVGLEFRVEVRDNNLVAHSGHLVSSYGTARWEWVRGIPPQPLQPPLSISDVQVNLFPADNFSLIYLTDYSTPPGFPPQAMTTVTLLANRLGQTVSRFFQSLHPIFAIRGFEEWGYPLPPSHPKSLEVLTVVDRAISLAALLTYNRKLEEEVSKRLQGLLKIQIRVQIVPPGKATIWARPATHDESDTLFTNEGSGANQLPFILVPIALASPNETILLSEPEAHLHPKAQSELTGLLLTIAKKQNLQFFIETHSEHVLHRLLHAVGKGDLGKEQLGLYYFVNEDGRAKVTRLSINDLGQVDGGLPGFFEQSLTELTEYLDALRKP